MAERVHPSEARATGGRHKGKKGKGGGGALPAPAVHRERTKKRSCVLCLLYTLITLIVTVAIAALLTWLLLKPKLLHYGVQDIRINTLSVDASQSTANSDISYTLLARNPNKKISIYYHSIRSIIWYHGTELGRGTIPAFFQGHRNTTLVDGRISGSNVQLSQSSASNLKRELSANSVDLDSETKVKFRLKVGALKLPRMVVSVKCDLKVPKSGSSVEKSCKLKRFCW